MKFCAGSSRAVSASTADVHRGLPGKDSCVIQHRTQPTEVALVQMPFAATAWPSLGLGLLKAAFGVGSV